MVACNFNLLSFGRPDYFIRESDKIRESIKGNIKEQKSPLGRFFGRIWEYER
jgi:hypothetical protein